MKIINFILCDDIRPEVGNKKSLMGVYTKELSFSVTAEEAGVWPKSLTLGMMLDFSVSAEIKKKAQKFKVSYSINGIEKSLGEGIFTFPSDENDQDADFQMTIFTKSQYHFESCGNLSHCVRIFDASGEEIAMATPMNDLLIKENSIES